MKSLIYSIVFISLLITGCKKNEQARLPVSGTYTLKGHKAIFSVNGNPEYTGNSLVIVSGASTVSYEWNASLDTLYKSLWAGDKISIGSQSYTSIYYANGTKQGYLVDSSANSNVSITVSASGGN